MLDGLLADPNGIVADFLPVSHKYTSLLAGVVVFIKLPLCNAVNAVAADKLGATEPLWHPLVAQLLVSIGCKSFEKLTGVVTSTELSINSVVFLVHPTINAKQVITSSEVIPIILFDMVSIFND